MTVIKSGTDSEFKVFSKEWWSVQPKKTKDEGKTANEQDNERESTRKKRKLIEDGKMTREVKDYSTEKIVKDIKVRKLPKIS